MPRALIAHVGLYPLDVARPKTDDTIPRLPLQRLSAQLLIRVVRRRPLQLPDEIADQNRRRDGDAKVHMRFDSADFVNVNPRRVDASALDVLMDNRLNLRHEQRRAFLGVPGDMEIDFGIIVARHFVYLEREGRSEEK